MSARLTLAAAVVIWGLAGPFWNQALLLPVKEPQASATDPGPSPGGLSFIANQGQIDGPTRYVASTGNVTAHLTDRGLALRLLAERTPCGDTRAANIHMTFVGADPRLVPVGESLLPTRFNWFKGNDPDRWVTDVPSFASVLYDDVWPGIDVRVKSRGQSLEYDFILEPGADLDAVRLDLAGADSIALTTEGALEVHTSAGILSQPAPATWTEDTAGERTKIDCRYALLDSDTIGFETSRRDTTQMLVIDPVIAFSSYLGGSLFEQGRVIAVAADGSVYAGGRSESVTDFPATPGSYDTILDAPSDGYVAKFDTAGEALEWATFLGGDSARAEPSGIALRQDGGVVVQGETHDADFPVVASAVQRTYGGAGDIFILELTPQGNALRFSTFLGGSGFDLAANVVLDEQDRIVIMGYSQSTDYPTTPDAAEPTITDAQDMITTRLTADGRQIDYSSYHGWLGSGAVTGFCRGPDGSMAAYGRTLGPFLPVTPGVFQPTPGGAADGFIMRFDSELQLLYCTYLGGGDSDLTQGIALDAEGYAYVTGQTHSVNFPTTPGTIDTTPAGTGEGFVSKITPDGSTLVFSTFLGGGASDQGYGIAATPNGRAVVTGEAWSTDFPKTLDAQPYQPPTFLTVFSPDGNRLEYSTHLSSGADEAAFAIALSPDGDVAYLTGRTTSATLPAAESSFDPTYNGGHDAIVIAVDLAAWTDLGASLAPANGEAPTLSGRGRIGPGDEYELALTGAPADSLAYFVFAIDAWHAPFKGGTLVPAASAPTGAVFPLITDGRGAITFTDTWPGGTPAGFPIYVQYWLPVALGPAGFTASNAVVAVTAD